MKPVILFTALAFLCSCGNPKPTQQQEQHPISDSLPGSTEVKSIQQSDTTESVKYYSDQPPSADLIRDYKKTIKELSVHNIDFCSCYFMIDTLSTMASKEGDYQYPLNPNKSSRYADRWFDLQMRKLLKDNEIPYKTGNNVWMMGYYFCPPKYK